MRNNDFVSTYYLGILINNLLRFTHKLNERNGKGTISRELQIISNENYIKNNTMRLVID